MRRDDFGPYSLDALKNVPIPRLFTTDAAQWKQKLVAWFEDKTKRTLYPMQIEMLLIEALAYAMSVLGEEGQRVAEQHLVALADAAGLERLGPNRSTPRLPSSNARATLRFTLSEPRAENIFIPEGTRVSAGGSIIFATLEPVVIIRGASYVDEIAQAQEAGLSGNGFTPGQITQMLDPIAGVFVANITTSEGGADIEDIELYRLRLANSFERISTGGSYAWYRETAIGVSSALIDMGVVRPKPCYVDLYPLTLFGAPGSDLCAQILAAFNTQDALDIRFGDEVSVKPPVAVIGAPVLVIRTRGAAPSIREDAEKAAQTVLKIWRERLGAIVAPSDIEAAVKSLPGVIDVELSGLPFQILKPFEFFLATSLTVNVEDLS